MKQSKQKNRFLNLFIMSGCFLIAFDFSEDGFHWIWKDEKQYALVLGIATIIFGVLWYLGKCKEKTIENNN